MKFAPSLAGSVGFAGDALEGTLDISLTDVTIHRCGQLVATGFGRVFTSDDSEPLIEVHCQLADEINSCDPFRNPDTRELIDENRLFEVTGWVGNTSYVARFLEVEWPAGSKSGRIVVSPYRLASRLNKKSKGAGAVALVTPLTRLRGARGLKSSRTSRSGALQYEAVSRDWWACKAGGFTYTFAFANAKASMIVVRTERACSQERILQRLYNWATTLSILCGHAVEVFGMESRYSKAVEAGFLRMPRAMGEPMPSPVPLAKEEAWGGFVKKCLTYLAKAERPPLVRQLDGCWNTDTNFHDIHQLAVAIAVEGLAASVCEGLAVEKQAREDFRQLKKHMVTYLDQNCSSFDPAAVKRLRGQIDSLPYNNSRVFVSRALHGLSMPEVPEEIAAWQLSRNALAHAKEGESSSQESLDQCKACLNLLYKLVLGVVGYKGPRVDIGPANLQGVRLTEWGSK